MLLYRYQMCCLAFFSELNLCFEWQGGTMIHLNTTRECTMYLPVSILYSGHNFLLAPIDLWESWTEQFYNLPEICQRWIRSCLEQVTPFIAMHFTGKWGSLQPHIKNLWPTLCPNPWNPMIPKKDYSRNQSDRKQRQENPFKMWLFVSQVKRSKQIKISFEVLFTTCILFHKSSRNQDSRTLYMYLCLLLWAKNYKIYSLRHCSVAISRGIFLRSLVTTHKNFHQFRK